MNSAIGMRKSAMSSEEKRKWLFYAILSAAGTAGAAAILRDVRSNKKRAKKLDARHSKNAIVVPVPIKDFMKDLPSPADVAASKSDVAPSLESAAPASSGASYEMTPEEIAAKKRSILSGRKIDFFSKAAEGDGGASPGKEEPADKPKEKPEENEGESRKEETSEPAAPRDQLGRFVSPTDPVGVAHAEKSAQFSSLLKPLGGPEDLLGAAVNRPLAASVGILGSVVLAAEISKAIRERRKEKSKKLMEEAQNQYASLIGGGSEKTAQIERRSGSLASLVGEVGGYALFVPAALAAIVTNKIISNRKKDKLAAKDKNNSYPDDPMIFYETKMGEAKPISAETALMMIMTKRAMIEDIERAYAERGELEKNAQWNFSMSQQPPNPAGTGLKPHVDYVIKAITDQRNRGKVLQLIKDLRGGGNVDIAKHIEGLKGIGILGSPKDFLSVAKTPEFREAVLSDPRLEEYLVDNFNTDKDWQAFRDNEVQKGMSDWAANGNWFSNLFGGFEKGGLMHQIMMWLAKTFGMGAGRERFNNEVRGRIGGMRDAARDQVAYRNFVNDTRKLYGNGGFHYVDRYYNAKDMKDLDPEMFATLPQPTKEMIDEYDQLRAAEASGKTPTTPLEEAPEQVRSRIARAVTPEEEAQAKADLRIDEDLQAKNIADAKERAMEEADAVQAAQQEAALAAPSASTAMPTKSHVEGNAEVGQAPDAQSPGAQGSPDQVNRVTFFPATPGRLSPEMADRILEAYNNNDSDAPGVSVDWPAGNAEERDNEVHSQLNLWSQLKELRDSGLSPEEYRSRYEALANSPVAGFARNDNNAQLWDAIPTPGSYYQQSAAASRVNDRLRNMASESQNSGDSQPPPPPPPTPIPPQPRIEGPRFPGNIPTTNVWRNAPPTPAAVTKAPAKPVDPIKVKTAEDSASSRSVEEENNVSSIIDAIYDLNYYRGLGIDKTKDNPWRAISGFPSDISYSATCIGDLDDPVRQGKVDDLVAKFMMRAKEEDRKRALDIVKKLSGKFPGYEKAFHDRHRKETNDLVKYLRGIGNQASGELADWMESWHRNEGGRI